MSAPTSPVDICNLALDHLKQDAIASIDTPVSSSEVICARWYHTTRRSSLRKHPWNFAIKRRTLTTGGTPTFGYEDFYNLPNDYLRLLTIGDDSIDDIRDKFQLEDGKILMSNDGGTIKVRYIYDITDVVKFDVLFVEILALEMALRMAFKFTGQNKNVERVGALLKEIAPAGYAVDGQERPPKRIQKSRLLNARRGQRGRVASPYTIFE